MGFKSDAFEWLSWLVRLVAQEAGVEASPGSLFTWIAPLTIIPFTAEGWRTASWGYPAS